MIVRRAPIRPRPLPAQLLDCTPGVASHYRPCSGGRVLLQHDGGSLKEPRAARPPRSGAARPHGPSGSASRSSRSRLISITRHLLPALIVAAGLQLTGPSCAPAVTPPTPESTFAAVENKIRSKYYGYESRTQEIEAIISKYRSQVGANTTSFDLYFSILTPMLDSLGESHNFASPPGASEGASTQGPRPPVPAATSAANLQAGLGLSIGWLSRPDEADYVFDVRRGSGADLAGVEPGLRVERLKISPTDRGGRAELETTGADGAARTYRFEFSPMKADAPREAFDVPAGYRVIRFDEFNRENVEWFREQLHNAPRGAIIDLRHNAGGTERSTRWMLGELLPASSLIGTDLKHGRRSVRRTTRWGASYRQPLAVLVGPESASSAEVFAAALQHHRRAILVGKTTAGSVMTSRLFSLPDGGTLSLAVSEFVAPDGRRLEGVGVRPDVDAISILAAVRAGRDILLEAAIAALEARATEVPEA